MAARSAGAKGAAAPGAPSGRGRFVARYQVVRWGRVVGSVVATTSRTGPSGW